MNYLAAIERRVGLTPTGLAIVAAAIFCGVVGRVLASRTLFLLVYGALLALVAAYLMGRRRVEVEAWRSDLPTRVRVGQIVEVEIAVTASRRLAGVVLEEALPEPLGQPVRVPVPSLPAGEAVRHSYAFTPARRGVFNVGPLRAEWADPFGLTRRRITLAEAASVIVHPAVEPLADRVTSREWEDPPIRPPESKPWPTGFEFYGMRDYVHGDDPRRIVWRATARTLDLETGAGRYLVREAEQGITDRVNLYFDTDRASHGTGDPSPSFETAVRVAASLGVFHLEQGSSVSLDANSQRVADRLRGRRARIPLLDVLAAAEVEPAPLEYALGRLLLDPHRAAHNVIITPELSQANAARLRVFLERGTSLLIVLILGTDRDPVLVHRVASLGCPVVELLPGVSMNRLFSRVLGARRR